MSSESEQLCKILDLLLADEIDCGVAQDKIEKLTMTEFDDLYSNLHHYYTDEDIRKRDPEYKEFQVAELQKLIKHLKSGNIKSANRVFFCMFLKHIARHSNWTTTSSKSSWRAQFESNNN
ncbi:hypothetical protein [uncultured Nitrosomonas sp.]|uniref:hypothetical protein n=1 Tax=uncultured Nitrosomonas sp. TaxID=156424 RepID=UPI0025D04485|nr:hypothetical protein [uncultured Nitrosomonas sp.]